MLMRWSDSRAAMPGLVLGEDTPGNEIALSQQIALMNSILIEIASIQAEQKVVQQRLLTIRRKLAISS